jgi:hypothetical protein
LDVAPVRINDLRVFNFGAKMSGTILACSRCELVFFPASTVSEGGEIGPSLLEAFEGLLSDVIHEGAKVVIDTSAINRLAHIMPKVLAEGGGAAYRVIVGPSFHNERGHLLIGLLQTIGALNTRRLGRIADFYSLEIAGFEDDHRPVWEIPQLTDWFFQLHEKVPSLPYWLAAEYLPSYYRTVFPGVTEEFMATLRRRLYSGHPFDTLLADGNRPLVLRQLAAVIASVWGEGNEMLRSLFPEDRETELRVRASCTQRINPVVDNLIRLEPT